MQVSKSANKVNVAMFNENLKVFFEKTDYLLREVSLKKLKIYKNII